MSPEVTAENVPVDEVVERAAAVLGPSWPLHSFVTANPLGGLEALPFERAVRRASGAYGGRGYPAPSVFRAALEAGRIDREVVAAGLRRHGHDEAPEESLERMEEARAGEGPHRGGDERVDRVLSKWLAAFLDEGRADWPMPRRSEGFYAAFRGVAGRDAEVPDRGPIERAPSEPERAVAAALSRYPEERWVPICEHHLTSLPGWAGFVKRREEDGGRWQEAAPVTLVGLLAARLVLTEAIGVPVDPGEERGDGASTQADEAGAGPARAEVWLRAWEATYRDEVGNALSGAARASARADGEPTPDAQLVFCIDTRSEILRRHLEDAGRYRTRGFAGFFGVPMRHRALGAEVDVDACPPILEPEHRIRDRPVERGSPDASRYGTWSDLKRAARALVTSLQSNPGTAFTYVESTGPLYGLLLGLRTALPRVSARLADAARRLWPAPADFAAPDLEARPSRDGQLPEGLPLEARVEYAAAAFRQMGWDEFARLVVFAGHAGRAAANPFASSLHCGACAGHPGGPSARVLAAVCNDPEVRRRLRSRGIEIPDETLFLAAEHETTTDRVRLYDADVPDSHREDVERLRSDLERARRSAASERVDELPEARDDAVAEVERRAADWAEPRPEWGLAGNAAFVVGPRRITRRLDFGGRSFLHAYDWSADPDGSALEAIMTGPMVVTQWINNHYYFAAVDGAVHGSGSKITQNPVGNVGVYQGNGGDLMTGLPLQSVRRTDDRLRHEPLRLTTFVVAPAGRVESILGRHEHLARLVRNGWMSLEAIDPERGFDRVRIGRSRDEARAADWTEPVRAG